MADNTLQFQWIVTIKENLDEVLTDAFVAGDLLWYPVEGQPTVRIAPDVVVAFGRPKGHRGSYKQWEEGGTPPHVVFEVWSPRNTFAEMYRKLRFYDRYGAEEFYLYDPDRGSLAGWVRRDGSMREVEAMAGWVSPRLGVRFDLESGDLKMYHRDGAPFLTWTEKSRKARDAEARAGEAGLRADAETRRADEETRRADEEQRRADEEQRRSQKLADRLREMGVDPEAL